MAYTGYGPHTLLQYTADALRDALSYLEDSHNSYGEDNTPQDLVDHVTLLLAILPAELPPIDTRTMRQRVYDYLARRTYPSEFSAWYRDGLRTMKLHKD